MDKSYIILKSEDRNKALYPNPNDFAITSATTFFGQPNITSLSCESVQFFYNIPNINATNNVLVIDNGTMSFPVTVPEGFYDYNNLATALAVQLNLLGLGVFGVTWDTTLYRFKIVAPVPVTIDKYAILNRDLAAVMGFPYNQPLATNIISQAADLAYTRNIYIISNTLHRNKVGIDQNSGQQTDVLFVVPVYFSSEFQRSNAENAQNDYLLNPFNIFYQPFNMKNVKWNKEAIGDIKIQLYDDWGNLLYNPWGNQFSWSFRMSLFANY